MGFLEPIVPLDMGSLGPIVFVGFFVGFFVGSLVGFIWDP